MSRSVILLALSGLLLVALGCAGGGQQEEAASGQGEATGGAGRSLSPQAAIGTSWKWVGTVTPVERIEVGQPQRYTLLLHNEGGAEVQSDCNTGRGSYEIEEGKLSFGPLISTLMACPPDSQDAVYMTQLKSIRSFFVEDGQLFLEMPADGGTMRFEKVEE